MCNHNVNKTESKITSCYDFTDWIRNYVIEKLSNLLALNYEDNLKGQINSKHMLHCHIACISNSIAKLRENYIFTCWVTLLMSKQKYDLRFIILLWIPACANNWHRHPSPFVWQFCKSSIKYGVVFNDSRVKFMPGIQILSTIVKKWTIEFQARPHCSYAHYQSGLAEIVQIKWGQTIQFTW